MNKHENRRPSEGQSRECERQVGLKAATPCEPLGEDQLDRVVGGSVAVRDVRWSWAWQVTRLS